MSVQHLRNGLAVLRTVQDTWDYRCDSLRASHESAAKALLARVDTIAVRNSDNRLLALADEMQRALKWSSARCDEVFDRGRLAIKQAANNVRSALGAASIHDRQWHGLAVVVRADEGQVGAGMPRADASVEDISAWWGSLDEDAQQDVIRRQGDQLGRIDGIPIPVRSRCHEAHLPVVKDRLRRELAHLQRRSTGTRRQRQITAMLEGLKTVERAIETERAEGREAYLVDVDTERWGAFRFSYGNPQTARRVVTYVAGGGTSLGNPGGAMKDAANILETTERLGGGPDGPPETAVILNVYQTRKPARFSALDPSITRAAASSLARFQHSLHVTHDPPVEGESAVRWVGVHHCHGGRVGAQTDRSHGYAVDAVTIMGIDGVGLNHADEFGVPEVYATMMDNDPLRRIRGLGFLRGPQPTDPKFGATVFTSGSGSVGQLPSGRRAHLLYLRDTPTLYNTALIILGNPPHHARPADTAQA